MELAITYDEPPPALIDRGPYDEKYVRDRAHAIAKGGINTPGRHIVVWRRLAGQWVRCGEYRPPA